MTGPTPSAARFCVSSRHPASRPGRNFLIELDRAIDVSEAIKLEDIIARRVDRTYRVGKRSDEWIKIKHANHTDVVVIGWRQGKGSRAKTFGSLLLAMENDRGDLTYAGRVGTGFSEADLTELRKKLDKITRKTPPVDDVPRDHRLRHPTWRRVVL